MKTYRCMLALGASLLGLGMGSPAFADQASGATAAAVRAERAEREIQVRLQNDAQLMNNKIEATVDGGIATLKGTVDSAAEKSRAARLAFVKGVNQVDNQLAVSSQSALAAISDTAITAELKARIVGEKALKSNDIHVETNNGVVTLTGVVQSRDASDRAAELAKSTDGVTRVENDLRFGFPAEPSR